MHLLHASDDLSAFDFKKLTKFLVDSPTKKIGLSKISSPTKENSNHSIVAYFISKYEKLRIKYQDYWLEVLDFLNSICKFNENGVNVNQMMISETFLQGAGADYFLQIELLKPDKLEVLIKFGTKELKYELIELFELIGSNPNNDLASCGAFLKKQLQLVSNLCFGRNYVNIDLMKKTFEMSVLMEYIWKEKLPEEIRAVFVSLLLNIHIDIKRKSVRIAPQYSKKFSKKIELENAQPNTLQKSPTKKMTLSINNADKSKEQTYIKQKTNAKEKLFNAVIDIKQITGNLKKMGNKSSNNPSLNLELTSEPMSLYNRNLNQKICEDILKDDYLIKEEQIKTLMSKILYYLEDEVKKSDIRRIELSEKDRKNERVININFNSLTLNIVEMVKKMVFFECFTQIQSSPNKTLFSKKKIKDQSFDLENDLFRLIKALINIISIEKKSDEEENKKNYKRTSGNSQRNAIITVTNVQAVESQSNMYRNLKKSALSKDELDLSTDFNTILTNSIKKKFIRTLDESKGGSVQEVAIDVKVKIEIIKILIFLMDLRHDDFINIIIDFIYNSIEELFKNQTTYNETLIQKAIQTNIQSNLPYIFSNGLNNKYPDIKLNYNVLSNNNLDKITENPLLPTLFYIFQFSNNYNLNYLVLQLIFEMFSQRQKLIKSLKQVHLIINPTDQLLFDHLKTKELKLRVIAETSEVWLVPPKKLDDPNFKYKAMIFQVRDILLELVSFCYNSFNINENHEVGFFERMCNEMHDEDINKSRQTMCKNLALHSIVLGLLKDGSYVLEYIEEKTEQNEIIIQMFESCYRFLLVFVKNEHKLNKKALISDIEFFMTSMQYYEVGQSDLLCEIFKNNYKLSLKLTDELLTVFFKKLANKTKFNHGHDPKYLKFFENIMFDKHEPIIVNIHKLINFIFDSNRKFEFLCMIENPYYKKNHSESDDEEPDPRSLWGHHIFDFSKEKTLHPYYYHSKALEILANCLDHCEDKQLLKLIIQKTFNLNYIFKLMSTDDIYFDDNNTFILRTVLKKPLYKLIKMVWLDSGKPPAELNNNKALIKFVRKQIDILKIIGRNDIDEIRKGRKSTVRSKLSTVKSEEGESDDEAENDDIEDDMAEMEGPSLMAELEQEEKSFNQKAIFSQNAKVVRKINTFDFISHLFENVLPLMVALMKKLVINERNIENIEDRTDLNSLYEYGENFANFVKVNLSYNEIKKYRNLPILDEFEKYFEMTLHYDKLYEKNDSSDKEDEEPNDWNLVIGRDRHLENEELPLNNILPEKKKEPVNYSKDHAWRVYLLNLLMNPDLKNKYIIPEKRTLIEAIKKIHELQYSEIINEYLFKKHHKMSMEIFIKKLVSFFKVWAEESPTVKDNVILSLIDLLQDLIESYESEDDLLKIQNLMNKCGLTETILSYFCSENACQKVIENLILLCISLLQGGNTQVQETIYNYMTKTPNSENFFRTLYRIINEQISFRNKKKSHFEKVDICFKQLPYSYQTKAKFGTEKVLRLLQLFTENHNSNLQNYLRYQANSRNNYDIIGLTVKILESCLFELNESNYQMASQCFDTLTEFIQGPCEANQLALVETPFTNIASKLLEINDSITQTKKQINKKNRILQLLKRGKKKKLNEKQQKEISKFQNCSTDTMNLSTNIINSEQQNEIESQKILIKYIHSLSPMFAKEIESSFDRYSPLGFQNWMLTGLKNKCVITMESLCEGQKNNDLLRKIMKNLSSDVLKENLSWIYEKKQKLYKENYNWEVYNDSEERLEKKGFILATGFKIFIILRKYLESDKLEDEESLEDMQLLKKEFNEVFSDNNLVAQLGHFGFDLIKTGVSAVGSKKN